MDASHARGDRVCDVSSLGSLHVIRAKLDAQRARHYFVCSMAYNLESDLSLQLPRLKNGVWIAFLFLGSEMVWATERAMHPGSESEGGYAAASAVVLSFVAAAYLLHCVSSYHWVLTKVQGWHHPISPRKAVGFHFIPIFNLYWNFRWPVEIARFVNWRTQKRRMSGILAGSVVLAGAITSASVDGALGFLVILCGFSYISRCLRDAFAAAAIPPELFENSGLDAAAIAI
jgi:hypothetical protein